MLTQSLRSRVYLLMPSDVDRPAAVALLRSAIRADVGLICFDPGAGCRRDALETLVALLRASRPAKLPVLVKGAADLALAAGADGVHLDALDLPVACVRRLLGPAAMIGATARSPQDAISAQADGATFVMVDGVYDANGQAMGSLVGAEGLGRVRAVCSLPICACGGVTPEKVSEVVGYGAELIGLRPRVEGAPSDGVAEMVQSLAAAFPAPRHVAP